MLALILAVIAWHCLTKEKRQKAANNKRIRKRVEEETANGSPISPNRSHIGSPSSPRDLYAVNATELKRVELAEKRAAYAASPGVPTYSSYEVPVQYGNTQQQLDFSYNAGPPVDPYSSPVGSPYASPVGGSPRLPDEYYEQFKMAN